MARGRDVKISILYDDDQVQRGTRDTEKALGRVDGKSKKTGSRISALGKTAVGALSVAGAGAALNFAGRMDEMANRIEAAERRADTVFGDLSEEAREWADEQNEAFGIGEGALLELIGATGDLLVPMGFAREEAFDLSQEILNTANALSEWTGGTIGARDAQEKITKALLGERDGLVELGVKISEADVKQQLLEDGTADLTGEQLEQAEAQATLNLIMGKSADALEAYGDRAGTAIAKTKELQASTEDAEETFAQMFKPVLDDIKEGLGDAAGAFEGLQGLIDDATGSTEEQTEKMGLLEAGFNALTLNTWPAVKRDLGAINDLLGEGSDETRDLTRASGSSADEYEQRVIPAVDGWAASVGDARDRLREAEQAQDDLAEAQLEAIDPLLQVRAKIEEVADAESAYADAVAEHGDNSEEAYDAALDLAQATGELNAAQQRWTEEGGAESEEALEALLEDAGLSRERIDELIASIERLNRTPVTNPGTFAGEGPSGRTRGGGGRAHGGPVQADTAYVVGEKGPELFVPNNSGTIIPNAGTGASAGMAGAGPTTINLVVDGKTLARVVRDDLIRLKRRNGTDGLDR